MPPITTTPLSPPPRPSSSRSVANSISGSTLCDYPITTGGNISAFGSRNGNWPALLLGDLHFTAAETNLVVDAQATSHSSSANANGGATSYSSTYAERGYSGRDRVDRLNTYFRPLTSTDTNVSNGTSSTSSINYSNNNFASTRTRSQTSTSSASTGRSRASTNRRYLAGGTNSNSSSTNQASSSSSSVNSRSTGQNHGQNSHPRDISPNGLGIGRYGPGTTTHNVPAASTTTTCTSSPISRSSSPTTQRSGGGHKRQHSMVSHEQIQTSNAQIVSSLPSGLVAVFVGATRGIGEATLKQFVRYAVAPRVYFVGRDRTNGERVGAELANLNPEGEYHFRSADVSLLANVDEVCREIKCKERVINLLFMSCGTTIMGIDTKESLHYPAAVSFYARIRFIVNLLPELQKATSLRRVVSVLNGTKEGHIDTGDFQFRRLAMIQARGHSASMMTLAFESLALEAPDVSFVHTFPGLVRTKLGQDTNRAAITVLRGVFKVIGPLCTIPVAEAGERQLFMATSAKFPAREGRDIEETSGVGLGLELVGGTNGNSSNSNGSGSNRPSIEIRNTQSGSVVSAAGGSTATDNKKGHRRKDSHSSHSTTSSSMSMNLRVARGTDGKEGSGVYSVSNDGEGLSAKTEEALRVMREEQDMVRKVWLHVEDEFVRITGCAFVA
ncbi:hypothetical protein QR685DRAFT_557266 [Neurospora intermedia]|uniref:Uncharacterized protein n=1 Tax=Neurospora intermedia TaxID=5142 RepID=A0ABR3D0X6_NEUIN